MMSDQMERLRRALREIKMLTEHDHDSMAQLNLSMPEALVIAYLRAAHRLLEQDSTFDALGRERAWAGWLDGISEALEEALRYRENEPLVMAVGVVSALLPSLHPQAFLRGFKTLEDAVMRAQRTAISYKRERMQARRRVKDAVARAYLWLGPEGDIMEHSALTPEGRAIALASGYTGVWGVVLKAHHPEAIVRLAGTALPLLAHGSADRVLIAPIHP